MLFLTPSQCSGPSVLCTLDPDWPRLCTQSVGRSHRCVWVSTADSLHENTGEPWNSRGRIILLGAHVGQEPSGRSAFLGKQRRRLGLDVASDEELDLSPSTQLPSVTQWTWRGRVLPQELAANLFCQETVSSREAISLTNHGIFGFRILNNIRWLYFQLGDRAKGSAYDPKAWPLLRILPSLHSNPSLGFQSSCFPWVEG